jgi:hypothetical protein
LGSLNVPQLRLFWPGGWGVGGMGLPLSRVY